jgi:hypothetical protein
MLSTKRQRGSPKDARSLRQTRGLDRADIDTPARYSGFLRRNTVSAIRANKVNRFPGHRERRFSRGDAMSRRARSGSPRFAIRNSLQRQRIVRLDEILEIR